MDRALVQAIEQAALADQLIADRRDFHRYAESGWTEFRTSSLIARRLDRLGFEVLTGRSVCAADARMGVPPDSVLEMHRLRAIDQGGDPEYIEAARGGFTGVVASFHAGTGPMVALRFDIDALDLVESDAPIHRPTREGFASVNVGTCHACGHDGHAAVGLGVAEVLARLRGAFQGSVRLIFQPAEEGVRGARSIVEAGHLNDVDVLIGHHLFTGWDLGEMAPSMNGYAATRKFDVTFEGAAAHAGGSPEEGRNALLAAATATIGLHALPRHRSGFTRVNVGRLEGGTGRNIVPSRAVLVAEVRGETSPLCDSMYERAMRVVESAASMYNCGTTVRPMGEAGTASCDAALAERVKTIGARLGGFTFQSVDRMGGSEDFTEMMRRVQSHGGLATNIGVGADLHGVRRDALDRSAVLGGHTPTFDFDERALGLAVHLLAALAIDTMNLPGRGAES
ncbi:MAG: amidohydrolase [Thermotogota bacterium]